MFFYFLKGHAIFLGSMFRTTIEYLEKPAADNERSVAALFVNLARALNSKDINLLAAIYSDDAKIMMIGKGGTMLKKDDYLDNMHDVFSRLRNVSFQNSYIRVVGDDAVISCSSRVEIRNKVFPNSENLCIACKKIDGSWFISSVCFL